MVGTVEVPSDKSISHRAALLAILASGRSEVESFLVAEDTLASVRLCTALGAGIELDPDAGRLSIDGPGMGGLNGSEGAIDCANSGTTMRLGAGIACLASGPVTLTGDASLCRRPMDRIVQPLRRMGANIEGRDGDRFAPLVIRPAPLRGTEHRLDVASAQVKSAILLAGLGARGLTRVIEPWPSRDHTERMLGLFGVTVERDGPAVSLLGGQELHPASLRVPGDLSSAAFVLAAGALVPDGDVKVPAVGLNPTRTGFLELLRRMGARVDETIERDSGVGEPWGSVRVRAADLNSVEVGGADVVAAIDELPLLAVLATQARGRTVVRDAAELRVKESDRIQALADGLLAMGAKVEATPDGFEVLGPTPLAGAVIDSAGDHRIAMAFAVAGLVADRQTVVRGAEVADISFPGFADTLNELTGGCLSASADPS